MRRPGIEPGADRVKSDARKHRNRWQRSILPLNHQRLFCYETRVAFAKYILQFAGPKSETPHCLGDSGQMTIITEEFIAKDAGLDVESIFKVVGGAKFPPSTLP